jgi:hypothetical protein
MSVFKDLFNGLKGVVRSIGRGIRNVTRGISKTLGLIAKPFAELGIVGTLALGIMMPWSMGTLFKGFTSPEGWLAKSAKALVNDDSLVKKALGFVMTGVHKGAALTQQGLGTAKSFITDKLSQGSKWLSGQVEEKGIEQVTNFQVEDLNLDYDAEQELWEKGLTKDTSLSSLKGDSIEKQALTKVSPVRESILSEVPKRLYNKFMEGAESGVKEFGYNILGGKGSNTQGTMDQPDDLGNTYGYTKPYDFINNRTSVPLSNASFNLQAMGGTYGGYDYMAEAAKIIDPTESFWNPEILTS